MNYCLNPRAILKLGTETTPRDVALAIWFRTNTTTGIAEGVSLGQIDAILGWNDRPRVQHGVNVIVAAGIASRDPESRVNRFIWSKDALTANAPLSRPIRTVM